jgi:hypothetical protein
VGGLSAVTTTSSTPQQQAAAKDAPARTAVERAAAAKLAGHAATHTQAQTPVVRTVAPPAPGLSLSQEIQNFAASWQPVVAIIIFVALIAVFWRML